MRYKVPVAIINWDSIEITEQCIRYLQERTDSTKISIQVVDNGSKDPQNLQKLIKLKELGMIDRIIALPKNMGFSIAFNILFEETEGKVFCYVSSDCLVESDWLEEGLNVLSSDQNIAAVCSNVFDERNKKLTEEDRELPQLYGAIMFIRRTAWLDVGCFDYLNFSPAYSEELDWSYRARKKGYKIILAGKSVAYHNESYTMNKKYNRKDIHLIRLTHRIKCRLFNWTFSELLFSWKWYLLETIDEVRNRTIPVLLRAFLRNLLCLPKTLEERKKRKLRRAIEFKYPYKQVATFL